MDDLAQLLSGGDLRSIGKSNSIVLKIKNQNDFDELFKCLFHKDRIVVMRAADIIEKITLKKPLYLTKYKNEILELCRIANDKELKWHLALLIPRFHLGTKELSKSWGTLTTWAKDKKNSRIVRVNSIQGLFELTKQSVDSVPDFCLTLIEIEKENIPSINARIRNIKGKLA